MNDVGTIVKFFNQELLANGAKVGLGFWNDERVNKVVTRLRDNMKMENILSGLVEEYGELQCDVPTMGENLFLATQFEVSLRSFYIKSSMLSVTLL